MFTINWMWLTDCIIYLKLGSGSHEGRSQASAVKPPSKSQYNWATSSVTMLRISLPITISRQIIADKDLIKADCTTVVWNLKRHSKSNRRQTEYPNAGLKWEISNREIRRFEIWFEISGANRGNSFTSFDIKKLNNYKLITKPMANCNTFNRIFFS